MIVDDNNFLESYFKAKGMFLILERLMIVEIVVTPNGNLSRISNIRNS